METDDFMSAGFRQMKGSVIQLFLGELQSSDSAKHCHATEL